jgi:hypothetical protein
LATLGGRQSITFKGLVALGIIKMLRFRFYNDGLRGSRFLGLPRILD